MQYSDRLEPLSQRFDEIEAALANPGGTFDQSRFTALMKERAQIEETVKAFRAVRDLLREIEANEALAADAGDPELAAMAQDELESLRAKRKPLEEHLQELMLPRDPNDTKDIFIEVRAGAGGDEAGIFAGDHRVQRVPVTESAGRVHTSTATVAVLPEVDEDDTDVEINSKDLEIDTFKASGAGGQHVNKTESAIRITHVPSGIIVSCSEERSQLQNRTRAMDMLRAQLAARKRREAEEAVGSLRRSQVGTGDRSEKIRTYNYPQDRITDHRINQNFQNIKAILDGDMERMVNELQRDERARLLAGETSAA